MRWPRAGTPLTVIGCARPALMSEACDSVACAHAGNLAQATPQLGVEGGDLGLRVSGLRGIHLEQQHVVAIEPEWDGLEIRERPHEQACGDQQQQRDGDLRHHERLRRAWTRDAVTHARAPLGDGCVFQRRHQGRTGQLQRGSEAEQQAAEQRQPQRDGQHVPVQFGVERESLLSVGQQSREHTDAGDGDEDAERAAE